MPEFISHYRILERLGEGGMGIVYRAQDERLERDVALKLLPAGALADESLRRRFRREALAASRVNHPNVGIIYDFDTYESTDFLVMEYVPGESLDRLVARGALTEAESLEIGLQIASALTALHERGVIHCDLKPANVVRTPGGQVKLLDFGLSRLLLEGERRAPLSSSDGSSWTGTLPYMAPEQFTGARLGVRTDLYALGVLLYELATGRAPHAAAAAAELMYAIVHTEAPPARRAAPALTAAFEALLAHALQKAPEDRFTSAAEMGEAMAALCRGHAEFTPVAPRRIRSLVVLPLANLSADRDQEFFVDGMTEALLADLAGIESLRLISRTSAMRYKGTSLSVPEIARELNVDAVVEGSVLRSGGRVRITAQLIEAAADRSLWAKSYERSLDDVLTLQREVARAIAEEIRVQLTPREAARLSGRTGVAPEAYELYLRGRYLWNRRSEEDVRHALEFFRRAVEIAPQYASAHAGIADAFNILGELEAMSVAEARTSARAAAERALALDPDLPEALTSLGFVNLFYDWDWPAAEASYRRAVAAGPGYATGHQWYSEYLVTQRRFADAEAEARHAVALDPLSPILENALSDALFFDRRYAAAEAVLRRMLEMHPHYAPGITDLARVLTELGRHDEAIAKFEEAQALLGTRGKAAAGLAYALARAGRTEAARGALREIEARLELPGAVGSLHAVGVIHLALGDSATALQWLRRAYEQRDQAMVWLRVHPRLDPLRGNPEFERIVSDMALAG
jgi:serine/threonine protein kinase/Tfp pilus assembly protein PilF